MTKVIKSYKGKSAIFSHVKPKILRSHPPPTPPPPQAINNDCYLKRWVKVGVGPAAGVEVYLFNLILIHFFFTAYNQKRIKGTEKASPIHTLFHR